MDIDAKKKAIILGVIAVISIVIYSLLLAALLGVGLLEINPITGLEYTYYYYDDPNLRQNALYAASAAFGVFLIFSFLVLKKQKQKLHGDAKWAKLKDFENTDPSLLSKQGLLLGKFGKRYLILGGQGFVLVEAPTRGGKGVNIVLPNCLTYPNSLIVSDVKKENYRITSGYRKSKGHKVYLFDPATTDYKTHRWNPLGYVSEDVNIKITDIQKIAMFLVPTPESGDPMWSAEARRVFLGICLLIDTVGRETLPFTIGEVYRQLTTEKDVSEHLQTMLDRHKEDLSAQCIGELSHFINLPPKQREGVASTLTSVLSLWANRILDEATSENDFDLRKLKRDKITIFIGTSPNNLKLYNSVISLFIQQIVDLHITNLPTEKDKDFLMLLDELPALGRLDHLMAAAGFIAGYKIRMIAIVQSIAQLKTLYKDGAAEGFLDNITTKVIFRPKNDQSAKEIAEEIGYVTTFSESTNTPRELLAGLGTKGKMDAKRHLILPQELRELPDNQAIVLTPGIKPIRAEKVPYYKDLNLLKRCVKPKYLDKAKKSKSQDELLKYVLTPAPIPTINVSEQKLRGAKTVFEIDIEDVDLPETEELFNDSEIEEAAESYLNSVLANIGQ